VLGVDLGAQAGNAVAVQNAIRGRLMKAGKPGYVDETFVSFEHAFNLILALGGVPCYPILADGASPICPYEASIEKLVQDLAARQIYCAELIPNRNSPDVLSAYARGLRSSGIFVLAGTEHNSSEMLPIEPRCAGGSSIPEPIQEIFWEGACVVAAHQFLTAHGQMGYVSADGARNTVYRPGYDRIEVFARLGASVISEYSRHTAARL
jgi:hypothetical protein